MTTTDQVRPAPARRKKRTSPDTTIVFAEVVRSVRFRPHVQRITLRSDEFPGFICDVPDQFITFIFPLPGGDRKRPSVDRTFTWEESFRRPPEEQPHARNYTVRNWRPETCEVDVDMILHEGSSIGTDWARLAEPGDALAIWGPRIAFDPPPNLEWLLLFGDDTALPAIGAILEQLGDDVRAHVVIEVDSEADLQPLPENERISVAWVYRNGAAPGTVRLLEPAIRSLSIPDAVCYGWGGGEHRIMNAIGKYLRRECGFRPIDVSTVGYWNLESH